MSAYQIGEALSWGEAADLVEAALTDPSTPLFAAINGWQYPASMSEILAIVAQFGKNSAQVLPFRPDDPAIGGVTEEQRAADQAEVEAEVIFTNS